MYQKDAASVNQKLAAFASPVNKQCDGEAGRRWQYFAAPPPRQKLLQIALQRYLLFKPHNAMRFSGS